MMDNGVRVFVTDMSNIGVDVTVDAELATFQIDPVDGVWAGTEVETGVSIDELKPWPVVPPHWIHLPGEVKFSHTNSEPSTKTGWLKHSRDFRGWGDAKPAVSWVSHVRGTLSKAIE